MEYNTIAMANESERGTRINLRSLTSGEVKGPKLTRTSRRRSSMSPGRGEYYISPEDLKKCAGELPNITYDDRELASEGTTSEPARTTMRPIFIGPAGPQPRPLIPANPPQRLEPYWTDVDHGMMLKDPLAPRFVDVDHGMIRVDPRAPMTPPYHG